VVQFDREASQTRGYCVERDTSRGSPILHCAKTLQMTIDKKKAGKSQIAGFNITSVTLVFGEFFKLTSPEEAEN
jgi:hypothetical protein